MNRPAVMVVRARARTLLAALPAEWRQLTRQDLKPRVVATRRQVVALNVFAWSWIILGSPVWALIVLLAGVWLFDRRWLSRQYWEHWTELGWAYATLIAIVALQGTLGQGTGTVATIVLLASAGLYWRHWTEAGWAAATLLTVMVAQSRLGGPIGVIVVLALAAALTRHPGIRAWLAARRRLALVRRDWHAASHFAGLREDEQRTHPMRREGEIIRRRGRVTHDEKREPDVVSTQVTAAGLELRVHLHSGWTCGDIERASERLASFYRARSVTVTPDPRDAGRATVTIVYRDPLAGPPLAWPVPTGRRSAWEPIPIGVDEHGREVTLPLAGDRPHYLVGGESGGGKSVHLRALIATAGLDPRTRFFLVDGKHTDLAVFEPLADPLDRARSDREDALRVLERARAHVDATLEGLAARGEMKVAPGSPVCIVVVDEVQTFTRGPGSKEFNLALEDLLNRGRSAGVFVIVATQKPEDRVLPSFVRDKPTFQLALRCSTRQMSDCILGQGWASRDYDASTLTAKGEGWFKSEGLPVRVRCYNAEPDDVRAVVQAAAELRSAGVSGPERPPTPSAEAAVDGSGGSGGPSDPCSGAENGPGPVGPLSSGPVGPLRVYHGATSGGKRTPTYQSWRKMRDRCLNPRSEQWERYGGRGITVCERWEHFALFLEDMGERPAGHTLDRIDVDGNYEPGNCKWSTYAEQRANQRRSRSGGGEAA